MVKDEATKKQRQQYSFYADDDVAAHLESLPSGLKTKAINTYLRKGFENNPTDWMESLNSEAYNFGARVGNTLVGRPEKQALEPFGPIVHEWVVEEVLLNDPVKLSKVLRQLEINGYEIFSVVNAGTKNVIMGRKPKAPELMELV